MPTKEATGPDACRDDHRGGIRLVSDARDKDRASDVRAEGRAQIGAERDKPEISPWSSSGKADCTTLTEGVSITPTPGRSTGVRARAPRRWASLPP